MKGLWHSPRYPLWSTVRISVFITWQPHYREYSHYPPAVGALRTYVRLITGNRLPVPQYKLTYDRLIVFNTTFNNISVISWGSVLLMEETSVTEENDRPATCHWQTLSHNVVSSTFRHERDSNSQRKLI